MGAFIGFLSIFIILICAVFLLINMKKRKGKKKLLLWLCVGLGLFVVASAITPAQIPSNENYIVTKPEPDETPVEPTEAPPGDTKDKEAETTIVKLPVYETLEETSTIITVKATVTRVIDGDTIEVMLDDGTEERVRLIGIDTPESTTRHEPYGLEASNFTKEKLHGEVVYLETDVTNRDRFERLLRYVWLDYPSEISEQEIRVKMFNAVLVLTGYAQVATYPPNIKYADYFARFQNEARESNSGLWGIIPAEPVAETETEFVGSAAGNKYHYPDCRWAQRISARNLIIFSSTADARNAGYEPCETCSPP